jgi:hypothetical protein
MMHDAHHLPARYVRQRGAAAMGGGILAGAGSVKK